jgi:putative intracellular protease/amidase
VATFCSEVERALAGSAKANYLSVQSAVDRHRDPDDALSLADFDFIHFPGGHAPMVDFRDSSWLGEIINLAYEHKVVLSLICHAPIAIASAALHIDECSSPCAVPDYPFRGAKLTTVSKFGGLIALTPTSQRSLARSPGCRNISTKS